MRQLNLIHKDTWFAWYPVRTENDGWAFWELVFRVVDERPEHYLGLLPTTRCYKI